jgi:hypothetical protein
MRKKKVMARVWYAVIHSGQNPMPSGECDINQQHGGFHSGHRRSMMYIQELAYQ